MAVTSHKPNNNVVIIAPVQLHYYSVWRVKQQYFKDKVEKRYSRVTFGWALGTMSQ